MDKVLVAGLGNPLMADEGVGVHTVRELQRRAAQFPHVDFVDLGTGGLTVLHAMAGRSKAVFIDCAFMDEPPGTIRRFAPEDAVSAKPILTTTAHAGDLLQTIELSRALGECPEEIVIFGIQPARVGPGPDLSPALAEHLTEYANAVARELNA